MKSYLTEAIGTFFLVLTIGLCVNQDVAMAPLAIGFALAIMVYAGGPISGGFYNPSVNVAVWIRGALPAKEIVPHWVSQFAGAILAAWLIHKFTGRPLHVAPDDHTSMSKALTGEFIFSFALSYVVLHVGTVKAAVGNSYFGLAIGATVMVGAFAMGPISGGAFNPAVGLAPALYEMIIGRTPSSLAWIYAAGPLLGAVAAAMVFKVQRPGE